MKIFLLKQLTLTVVTTNRCGKRGKSEQPENPLQGVYSHTVAEQWVVDHLQYTATVLGSSGLWITFSTLPRCWGAVGSGSPSVGVV